MKVAVITFPGSNCDYDLFKAAQQVGGDAKFIWHLFYSLGVSHTETTFEPGLLRV